MVSVIDPGGTVTYQTRADGQLAATIAPGNVQTLWEYDTYGRKTKMTDPSFGQTTYAYGTNGLLQKMTDADNKVTEYTYDTYHRLSTKKIPEMTVTYQYTAEGLLAKEFTNKNTATIYTYDDLLRPTQVKDEVPDGKWLQKDITYMGGNMASVKYTSHSGLNVTENMVYTNGHLTEEKLNNQMSYFKLTAENNLGIPSTVLTGNITRTYGYNEAGMITSRNAKNGTVVLQDFAYTFDGTKGNLTSRKDNKYSKTEAHTYDSMNRLLTYPGSTMTYNANGNITQKTDAATTLTYNVTGKPYATGEATGVTGAIPVRNQTVTYTSFKRPASISENTYAATFSYNERQERVKMHQTKNGAKELTRYYLGGRYEIDENAVGNVKEKLYIGGDYYSAPAVYVRENNGSWQLYYICRDYLGSITHLTNSSGSSVTQELSYDAWGRLRNSSTQAVYAPGQEPTLFLGRGYTGHEHLPWFGLINMNARLYDPALGRFLSPDPYVQNPESTQNYNRYTYCMNNPFSYTDPDGEFVWFIPLAAAVIGGAINVAANWGNIDGFWQGFTTFAVGAGAGFATAATAGAGAGVWAVAGVAAAGGAVTSANNSIVGQTGHNFNGFNQVNWRQVGVNSLAGGASGFAGGVGGYYGAQAIGSIVINGTKITNPVLDGAIRQGLGGSLGGYAGGFASGLILTGDLGQAHSLGTSGLWTGMATGVASGLASGYISARQKGLNPWTGKPLPPKEFVVTPEGVILPKEAKYRIPPEYKESPYNKYMRNGTAYGIIENGEFVEKIRIERGTPTGQKGPNISHYHLDMGDEHLFRGKGDPGFKP